jgi:predicted nucleic acid-binding protein
MIPAILTEHEHHERAVSALNRHLRAGDSMIIVAHTLLETYSSVTRMPPPMRVTPSDALVGIRDSFLSLGTVISLGQDEYVQLLQDMVSAGTVGGQVYDAAIAACARRAGVDVILTFNERHFERFAGDGLSIEVP